MPKKVKQPKVFTPTKRTKMQQLLEEGRSVYAIAKELDLTPSVARYHAHKMKPKTVSPVVLPGAESTSSADATLKLMLQQCRQEKERLEIKVEVMRELMLAKQ